MNLEDLRKKIQEFNNAYEKGKPIVEDYIYDFYKKKLEIMENSYKYKVSKLIGSHFSKDPIAHLFPILSLNHNFGKSAIDIFINKIKKKVDPFPLVVELKIDGVSVIARYKNGQIAQLKTRGNGFLGENIFHLKDFLDIPNEIEIKDEIELRFEAYFNKNIIENPRNAAAGILLKKHPDENLKYLKLCPHNLYSNKKIWNNYIQLRKIFEKLHLNCIEHYAICYSINECYDFFDKIEKIRNNLPYEIDGIVFKINDKEKQDILGNTCNSPKHSFAIKFSNSFNVAEIKSIEFQVGRHGSITPVAVISNTLINNKNISKATLNNINDLKKKNYAIKDIVKIEMAGDVIPKITDIIEKNNKNEIDIKFCPSCKKELNNYICQNGWNCEAQKLERLIYFASKNCMNIKNLGAMQIKFFVQEKILNFPYNFFEIKNKINKISSQPNWLAEKSFNNLLENIEKSKYNSIEQFYTSLGIPNLGKNKIKLLVENFNKFQDFLNATEDQLIFLGKTISKETIKYIKKERFWIEKTYSYMKINQIYKKIDLFDFI